ncbi:TPA: hypothetical protein U2D46_001752 [Streptococcus suis]|nr:hypothetical protein [Streptococcus suis]HEM6472568.1 hypothetical protein [Streptococcus suis]
MELNQYQKEMQHLLQLQDQRVNRQLYNLYVDIVKELKKSLLAEYQSYENLSRSKKMDLKRMSAMLEAIDSQSQKLKTGLNGTIPDHLERVGKMAYNELFYEYEQTRSAIQFALLPEEELKTIIETPIAGLRLSQRINDGVVSDLRKNIKSELTRSFVHGLSYQRTAKRLSELGSSSYRRALNITRTEAGRVSAIARQRSQKEAVDLGIEFKKMWVATLDKRTRNTHQYLDGQQVGPEEYFEHNGLRTLQPHMFGIASEDCNCRCRTISRLKDDDTPLLRRDSETGEVVEYKNYKDWESSKRPKSDDIFIAKNPDEIDDFFEKQKSYQEWYNKVEKSSEKKEIINAYTTTEGQEIFNKILRDGLHKYEQEYLSYFDEYDKPYAKQVISERLERNSKLIDILGDYTSEKSFITYRGTRTDEGYYNKLKVGEVTSIDKGFLSTSLDRNIALDFSNDGAGDRYLFDIRIPKGSNKGAYIAKFSDMLVEIDEKEFLLQPDSKFKVLSIEKNSSGLNLISLELQND